MTEDHNLTSDSKAEEPAGKKGTDEPWKQSPQRAQDPTENAPTNPTGKKPAGGN